MTACAFGLTASQFSGHARRPSSKLSTTAATSNDLSLWYRSLSIHHHLLFVAVRIPVTFRQDVNNENTHLAETKHIRNNIQTR